MRFSLPLIASIGALFLSNVSGAAIGINARSSPINAETIGVSPDCAICELAMTQIDELLKNNATESDVKSAVHTVCNYLPTSFSKNCNDFIYEYADIIIQLVIGGTLPLDVCPALSVC
ncbi:Saposin, partial [Basidiobolus meristosporus CBS 931.73]